VTVSGISSGAYAATQVHVALSGTVSGAALLAGGPYRCAEGQLAHALGRCISGQGLEAGPLVEAARAAAEAGDIDPLAALADDRVWLFHGRADPIVAAAVNTAAAEFYRALLPETAVTVVDDMAVTHGWPTLEQGAPCGEMGGDYINACGYDAAGALLQHLYGPLEPPAPAGDGGLRPMQQASVVPEGGSFADTGYVYIPSSCEQDVAACRLHVAFHGCRQGKEFLEDRFARGAGLNEWAESNGIIVLYPQVNSSLFNPQGCWDWWGYTGPAYDLRSGPQVAGVAALIEAWSRPGAAPSPAGAE
jgi:poly(3-hydroxybutyrate) depolymerase